MIHIIKVNQLSSKFSIDNVEFNIDIIKKYMKDNSSNTLYLLKNPYEYRFYINNDNLNGLINDETYGMINLDDKQIKNIKINDDNQDKNKYYNIYKHLMALTETCQRISIQDEITREDRIDDINKEGKELFQQFNENFRKNEKITEELLKAIETKQKIISKLLELD